MPFRAPETSDVSRRIPLSILYMARRKRTATERLRNAVQALPRHTKEAMLRGIRSGRVITGGYTDGDGGACPMLSAHRNGGRTDMGTFARAWDEFTGTPTGKPREATAREIAMLRHYLERALVDDPGGERSLAEEVREVQEDRRRRAESAAIRSSEDLEDVLSKTYAAAAERRAEQRAEYLLASEPVEETPLGIESGDGGPSIEVRRRT